MGSRDEGCDSHLAGDTNISDQRTSILKSESRISDNFAEEGDGGRKITEKKKETMKNVTIGGEDHIVVIHDENVEKEEGGKQTTSRNKGKYVTGQQEIICPNDSNTKEVEKGIKVNSEKDYLKGGFFVHRKREDDSNLPEPDSDSPVLEKSLTLAVCSPDLLMSMPKSDANQVFEVNTKKGGECRHNETPDEKNETEEDPKEKIDSKATADKHHTQSPNNNDDNEETSKPGGHKSVPDDNCYKQENGEIRQTDRFQTHSRANTKHGKKNRYQLQDTVPEIDETREDVLRSVKRTDEEKGGERRNSIDLKMPWKHQNKLTGRNKQPIKDDLHVDSSQTRSSMSIQPVSSLFRPQSACTDKSRLHAALTNEELIKPNKCRELNSFVSNIPKVNGHEDSCQSRLSFDCTSSTDIHNGERKFVSVCQRKYTKLELRKALPRKSFFSCHDKAMKDAGLEIEDPASKRRAERLKAKLERIAREYDPLPSRVVFETGKENNGISPSGEHSNVSISITDAQNPDLESYMNEENYPNDASESGDVNSEDMVDAKSKVDSFNPNITAHKKKRLHPEKTGYVECKPLSHYLEYVKENETEYENFYNGSKTIAKHKPIRRLISLGKAFELRHRGGSPKSKGDDVVVMAAKALRPRSSDASRYYKHEQDKSSGLRSQDTMLNLRQTRPSSDDKRRQEKNSSNTNTTKDDEHAKTELERKRIRAEDWAMSVSTNTLTKAKIQSLRELGTDDEEVTKWWVALKRCHYLRVRRLAE